MGREGSGTDVWGGLSGGAECGSGPGAVPGVRGRSAGAGDKKGWRPWDSEPAVEHSAVLPLE